MKEKETLTKEQEKKLQEILKEGKVKCCSKRKELNEDELNGVNGGIRIDDKGYKCDRHYVGQFNNNGYCNCPYYANGECCKFASYNCKNVIDDTCGFTECEMPGNRL